MKKRGIVFDLDGTLLNSTYAGLGRFLDIAEKRGLVVDHAVRTQAMAMWSGGAPVEEIVKTCFLNIDAGEFRQEWQSLDIRDPHPLLEGVSETLELLCQRSMVLSIFTNRWSKTAVPQLERNGILGFFKFVHTRFDSAYRKPHPLSISSLLNWYQARGISKEEILFVGDTVKGDWLCAKEAGVDFMAVIEGSMDTREQFIAAGLDPQKIILRVTELPDIL